MTPSRDELRARLEELQAQAPAPRPHFVARLEARLRAVDPRAVDTEVEPAALPGGRRPGPALVLGAAAVVIAVLMLLPGDNTDRQLGVTGQPTASTSEVAGEFPVPDTTTATAASAPPSPTTTATPTRNPAVPSLPRGPATPDRKSVTTRPPGVNPTTTTTRPPEPERLGLRCVAGQPDGRPGVECVWTESTVPEFASYRLWRATGTAPKQVVFSPGDRSLTRYVDRDPGVQHYEVEALDGRGRVVGRSSIVEAACC